MIEAIVFDLDGVLVDSEPVWERIRRGLVAERGGHWAPDAQRRLMGMSTPEWARYLSEDLGVGLPPDKVAALRPAAHVGAELIVRTWSRPVACRSRAASAAGR